MCGVHGQSLRPGEVFVPAPLAPSARGVSSSLADDVRSTFVLAETIAVRQLDAALRRQRAPLPPLEVQVGSAPRRTALRYTALLIHAPLLCRSVRRAGCCSGRLW